jgi:hypothetical protein
MAIRKAGKKRARAASHFCLYVVNHTPRSRNAVNNPRTLCRGSLGGRCSVKVIDVTGHPEEARTAQIVVTTTLVKSLPRPDRLCVGDLSDLQKVMTGLEPALHAKCVRSRICPRERRRQTWTGTII